jgi:predicted nucleotidyltransferase
VVSASARRVKRPFSDRIKRTIYKAGSVLTYVLKKGTIVLKMSTKSESFGSPFVLFGKTRRSILALFLTKPDKAFYLRQVARITGSGLGSVQREVENLAKGGVIARKKQGRQVFFQANTDSPVFVDLKNLIVKTSGMVDVLRDALARFGDGICAAFVYGSFAKGRERTESDVDVFIIGEVAFDAVVSAFSEAQSRIGREINPSVYSPQEYKTKVKKGGYFITSVLKGPKIFVIGNENELARLARQRMAG